MLTAGELWYQAHDVGAPLYTSEDVDLSSSTNVPPGDGRDRIRQSVRVAVSKGHGCVHRSSWIPCGQSVVQETMKDVFLDGTLAVLSELRNSHHPAQNPTEDTASLWKTNDPNDFERLGEMDVGDEVIVVTSERENDAVVYRVLHIKSGIVGWLDTRAVLEEVETSDHV